MVILNFLYYVFKCKLLQHVRDAWTKFPQGKKKRVRFITEASDSQLQLTLQMKN